MAYGQNILTKFNDLGLAGPILDALRDHDYTQPTPIQEQAIPVALKGSDILGIAQTGTGKTASFVLPILDRLARNDRRPTPKASEALILAPTRELVAQIAENIRKYSKYMRVSVSIIVGGVKPGPQIRKLASGSHIIVATPGRLLDHINNGHVSLKETRCVILDEADHMLDLGFIPDIRRIMKQLPKQRQTSLLSATMPQQIKALASDFQNNPVEVAVAIESRPIERIAQSVRHMDRSLKRNALTRILGDKDVERAIVFTRTKRGADRVSQHLQKAGLAAAAIHGNKSQNQRTRALAGFKSGETNIMVATDIAARGIDIDDVSHVVNFELPEVAEAYVHRIGRTARAGRSGVAISLCDPSETRLLRDIEKLIGVRLPSDGDEGYAPQDNLASEQAAEDKTAKATLRPDASRQKSRPRRKSRSGAQAAKASQSKAWSPLEEKTSPDAPGRKSTSGNRARRNGSKAAEGKGRPSTNRKPSQKGNVRRQRNNRRATGAPA